jgi:DNA polymerase
MQSRLVAAASPATSLVPARPTLPMLRDAARTCAICEGCERTNGVVFGEGPERARIMLVGEQPGDREDVLGRPFVGPAGELLDEVLGELRVDRGALYLTNAVKHFHWEPRGKQRLHRSPKVSEIDACRPWLDAEIDVVAPRAIVCLGAVAARSFMGHAFRLHKARGQVFETRWAKLWLATHHPAAVLRMADASARSRARRELADDLSRIIEAAAAAA